MMTVKVKLARLAHRLLITMLGLTLSAALFPWLLRAWVNWHVGPQIYLPGQEIPATDVALVLGAGLQRNGRPTVVLHDRVVTAVELYQQGRVKKLLMSGDNRYVYHNEPGAMRDLAVELGVPPEDIVLDDAGQRTYDSCYRAHEIFAVKRAAVVTQRFHLNRALYLCQNLGIEAVGAAADRRPYRGERWWQLRELAALANAWLDVHFLRPVPVLGEKLPIVVAQQ